VRTYAQRDLTNLSGALNTPCPARLEQTLEFQFAERFDVLTASGRREFARSVTVVGSYTEAATLFFKQHVVSFAIFFQPLGLSRLFRIPPSEFTNRSFDACDVLPPVIRELYQQLAECNSFTLRVETVETFLRHFARLITHADKEMGRNAAARIFEAKGAVRMTDLAAGYGISLRQLERRIRSAVGIAPKMFARIARFQTALDAKLLAPNRSWMSIAHALGYHDQMHMVHDFHQLAGAAPAELLARIGDARPPAMPNYCEF
jgi:AraC-like DNA-binding protein